MLSEGLLQGLQGHERHLLLQASRVGLCNWPGGQMAQGRCWPIFPPSSRWVGDVGCRRAVVTDWQWRFPPPLSTTGTQFSFQHEKLALACVKPAAAWQK
jgi:hypothetical protein